MSKRYRYLLIVCGLVIFAALAPTIAFFASGLTLDLQNHSLVKTGILAFKIEPKKAPLFLDGVQIQNPGETIRFLKPKDYQLRFAAPRYCTWEKTLPVNSGEVTWASPFAGKIFLLKNQVPAKILSLNSTNFLYAKNKLFSLEGLSLKIYSTENLNEKSLEFNQPLDSIFKVDDGNTFLISDTAKNFFLLDAQNQKVTKLTAFSSQPKVLSNEGTFFTLSNRNLSFLDDQLSPKHILGNVLDFDLVDSEAYALQTSATTTKLITLAQNNTGQAFTIAELPKFTEASLYITDQKQIFVLGDQQLYQIGLSLKNLGWVSQIGFEPSSPSLVFFGQGETDFYDFGQNQSRLISRSGTPMLAPHLAGNIGYAFWQKNNSVEAMELDSRGQQNSCVLYQGEQIKKYQADEENKKIFVLDGTVLKEIEIR